MWSSSPKVGQFHPLEAGPPGSAPNHQNIAAFAAFEGSMCSNRVGMS